MKKELTRQQRSLIIHCLEEMYYEFTEPEQKTYREICLKLNITPYFTEKEGSPTQDFS